MNGSAQLDVRRVGFIALVLVALVVAVLGLRAYSEGQPPFGPDESVWHSVFLTNDQVFFGHLYDGPGDYVLLRDVFYVQQVQGEDQSQQGQLVLQRRGGEIHGPDREMRIAKQQILFIEKLRADSALVAEIRTFGQNPATQPPASTAAPTGRSASPTPTRSP